LISKQIVTEWQYNKLLSGRWKGFHVDDYRLLDLLGHDDLNSNRYSALNVGTGENVVLVVTRLDAAPWFDYSVE
jgi:hypothetical protein